MAYQEPPRRRDYYPAPREDFSPIVQAVSDRLEDLRRQNEQMTATMSDMRVLMEQMRGEISRLRDMQAELNNKVDKPFFEQVLKTQAEKDTRQDEAIERLENNQQQLLDMPRRIDKLENAPQRWAPYIAILVAILMPLLLFFAQKVP